MNRILEKQLHLLSPSAAKLILYALETKTPIIVGGQQGPTGKSTLVRALRAAGADCRGDWEPDVARTGNRCSVLVVLDEIISAEKRVISWKD